MKRTLFQFPHCDGSHNKHNAETGDNVGPLITANAVTEMATLAAGNHVDTSVLAYITHLAEATRAQSSVKLGLSTRGCMSIVRAAKTWAAAQGRNYVIPDDIKELAQPVLSHRVVLDPEAEFTGTTVTDVVTRILSDIKPPTERAA